MGFFSLYYSKVTVIYSKTTSASLAGSSEVK